MYVCNCLEARLDFCDEQQTSRRVLVQVDDVSCLLLRGDGSVRSSNNVCPDKLLDRRGRWACISGGALADRADCSDDAGVLKSQPEPEPVDRAVGFNGQRNA